MSCTIVVNMSHEVPVEEFYKNKVPILGFIIGWMGPNDMDYGHFAAGICAVLLVGIFWTLHVPVGPVFSALIAFMPIWLPVMLFLLFFHKWMEVVGYAGYIHAGRTTMRIKLPPEVTKSPEAMEIVLAQIHNTQNPDNLMQTYLQGKRPLPIGLEIASIGGEIRFYVNTPTKKSRDAFEANMYAQYPGVEIIEEPVDYLAEVPLDYSDDEYTCFSLHMGKKKDDVFPIKTYIDYGLDKMPKEEEKVDPMTPMLEVLSTIKPFERIYVQFVITAYRKDSFMNGQLKENDHWEKSVNEKVDELMQRDPETKAPKNKNSTDEENDFSGSPRITPGERDTIEAMERNVSKYPYWTGIRWYYVTKAGQFNGNLINPVIRSFSQYDMIGRNQVGVRWRTDFGYMKISDPTGKRLDQLRRQELKELKQRKYFQKGGADGEVMFSVEELATMFHLPGTVALTPTLNRIESARSEAPSNLPVGIPTSES